MTSDISLLEQNADYFNNPKDQIMIKSAVFIFVITFCSFSLGWGNKIKPGVYVNSGDPKLYLEFRSSGSFYWKLGTKLTVGKYESEEDIITLILAGGQATRFLLRGDTLMSAENRSDEEGPQDDYYKYWILWHGGKSGHAYETTGQQARIKEQLTSNNKKAIIDDLVGLAADAYQFKIRPTRMGGGNGSYSGYAIDAASGWGTYNPNATYNVILATETQLILTATSKQVSGGTVKIECGYNGKVTSGPNATGF